jgi:PPM family protein phosphatase
MASASENSGRLMVVGAMSTNVGRVRTSNEDTLAYIIPSDNAPEASRGCLALVADGMGGHAAGEVASVIAAEVVRRVYFSLDAPVDESLTIAFDAANRAILDHAETEPECKGMGTTCTAIVIRDGNLWLAHIGDSRAYLIRDGQITQLSDDQTLGAQMERDGLLTEEMAKNNPMSNIVLQALGARPDIAPTVWKEGRPLADGDFLLLCSDGLSNLVTATQMTGAVRAATPNDACKMLIDAALDAGGHDNVSVGIFALKKQTTPVAELQVATRQIMLDGLGANASTAGSTRVIKLPDGLS